MELKDYTLEEVFEECVREKYIDSCKGCRFYKICSNSANSAPNIILDKRAFNKNKHE